MRRRFPRHIARLLIASLIIGGVVVGDHGQAASALSGSDFNAGYIISDANFYNGDALNVTGVQAFLQEKVSSCVSGYTCLKDYTQNTPTVAANSYCGRYVGGTRSAADIIARVGQSCGISQKVLLVMLQKEQGLVTAVAPSDEAYSKAMGYACPDGAPCDSAYYGFFNQVYNAAKQMKRYLANPDGYTYQLGTNWILYSDKSNACGTKKVNIVNQATRALYIYTPYTPNAAALANLSGTGDSCSSYGNRNFWVFYSTWFGDPASSPSAAELITTLYYQLGGAATLGSATGQVTKRSANGGGYTQAFENGVIFYSLKSGDVAAVYLSPILEYYERANYQAGSLGWPTGSGSTLSANGGGFSQTFDAGAVFYSTSSATAYVVDSSVFDEYANYNYHAGSLGWPTGSAVKTSESIVQNFQGGVIIYDTARKKAWAVRYGYYRLWLQLGGISGDLGLPTSAVRNERGGAVQDFTGGSIFWTEDTGFIPVLNGVIRSAYRSSGWQSGVLGWPTSGAVQTDTGISQAFQSGSIVWNASTRQSYLLRWGFNRMWNRLGGLDSDLGAPTSAVRDERGGAVQDFTGGSIFSTQETGYVAVLSGPIRNAYRESGWQSGILGWPVANEVHGSRGRIWQAFEGGTILYDPETGTSIVPVG